MSSSSSSSGGSLALAAATAVAVSGSLVILSLCRAARSAAAGEASLRPCLSSSEKRRQEGRKERKRRAERRVRFAEDVVDNEGAARPARRLPAAEAAAAAEPTCRDASERMPANREALYRCMLRDRSTHRVAYSC
ncbi:hypothetical protein GUJ93_ZPchr0006g42730 [Zizania palustris]|uniref:Uncharacterized protein n=1 Tax=Zizania palustris TaxID=103762 RepID=A0A8J5SPP5_ZIZPA|nr:hypothetical protein GUJ93_ZPchr0006g42730 [Zizania palustris]